MSISSNSSLLLNTGQTDAQILKNLQAFHATQKLQQAVFSFISSQLISREELKKLSEYFRSIDHNGDGRLDRNELISEYSKLMPEEEAKVKVENIMKEVDADNNGYIDYSEFVMAAMRRETMLDRENLEAAFKIFDSDGDGHITAEELKEVLQENLDEEDSIWEELISLVDKDGNGEIELKEFKDMMLRML